MENQVDLCKYFFFTGDDIDFRATVKRFIKITLFRCFPNSFDNTVLGSSSGWLLTSVRSSEFVRT